MSRKQQKAVPGGLLDRLHRAYPAPAWLVLPEVRDATGFDCQRSADALVVGMYSSRGYGIRGFEFKVSRADWLSELSSPDKAESWFRFCSTWSLVVSDFEIVRLEELPARWGLMAPHNSKLKVIRAPVELEPSGLDGKGLAALLYSARQQVIELHQQATSDVIHKVHIARAEGYEDGKRSGVEGLATLQEKVDNFEAASGITLSWRSADAQKLGKAVKAVLTRTSEWESTRIRLQRAEEKCTTELEAVRVALQAIESVQVRLENTVTS